MQSVDEIYFDSISEVRMDAWVKGRVALGGDAAACPSLIAGGRCGFALAEAYVLAGEGHRHSTDPSLAFKYYQERLIPIIVRDFETLLMRLPSFPAF